MSIEQIRRGEHTTSPLFEALRIAERFGQDPTTFLERLRQMPAAELETLRWYAAIRMVQDMAAE